MPLKIDIVGKRFNKLIVLSNNDKKDRFNKIIVECVCDCGEIKYINKAALKNGSIKSCGCHNKQVTTKHGMFGTKLYKIIDSIIQRCFNGKCYAYKNYGGRGITVCKDWIDDRSSFINWALSNGYKDGLDIDRINNNGNYEPSNCRFVTRVVNNRNRRSNKIVVYNGESMCLKDCCEKSGLDYGKTRRYLYNHKDKTIDHLLMSIPK